MAERQTKIKGCRNDRDYFSMGIIVVSGWSSVNEEHTLRVWALPQCKQGSLSYSTNALIAGLESEQGKAQNKE